MPIESRHQGSKLIVVIYGSNFFLSFVGQSSRLIYPTLKAPIAQARRIYELKFLLFGEQIRGWRVRVKLPGSLVDITVDPYKQMAFYWP